MEDVAWNQLQDAYGSADEVGEILDRIAQGEDIWMELWNRVLHQGKLYEATIPVATWFVQALQSGKLGERLIPVGRTFGTDETLGERTLAFGLLSAMASSATAGYNVSCGCTPQKYASIAARLLAELRRGISIFEQGLADRQPEVREASTNILKIIAFDQA